MQIVNAAAVSALVLAGLVAAQDTFSVNTPPSLIQCQPYLIVWVGGTAPFFPRITQPGAPADIIENFPETSERQYSWTVNQPVGQSVTIVIGDSDGANAASAQTPAIAAGSSSSCLDSGSSSSSTVAAGPSGTTTSTASAPTSSAPPGTSTSGTSSRSSSSSSSAPPATTSVGGGSGSNGSSNLRGFAAVVAGTVGVVVAALL